MEAAGGGSGLSLNGASGPKRPVEDGEEQPQRRRKRPPRPIRVKRSVSVDLGVEETGFAEKTAPFIQSHFRVKVEVNTHEAGKLFVEISGDSTTDQLHGVAHLFRYAVRRCREGLKLHELALIFIRQLQQGETAYGPCTVDRADWLPWKTLQDVIDRLGMAMTKDLDLKVFGSGGAGVDGGPAFASAPALRELDGIAKSLAILGPCHRIEEALRDLVPGTPSVEAYVDVGPDVEHLTEICPSAPQNARFKLDRSEKAIRVSGLPAAVAKGVDHIRTRRAGKFPDKNQLIDVRNPAAMRLFSHPPVLQALALEKGLQEGAIWMIPSKCGVLLSMQLVKEDAAEEEIKAFHNTCEAFRAQVREYNKGIVWAFLGQEFLRKARRSYDPKQFGETLSEATGISMAVDGQYATGVVDDKAHRDEAQTKLHEALAKMAQTGSAAAEEEPAAATTTSSAASALASPSAPAPTPASSSAPAPAPAAMRSEASSTHQEHCVLVEEFEDAAPAVSTSGPAPVSGGSDGPAGTAASAIHNVGSHGDRRPTCQAAESKACTERLAAKLEQAQQGHMAEKTEMQEKLDNLIGWVPDLLRERDAALAERDAALAERDAALAGILRERGAALAERNAALAERNAALEQQEMWGVEEKEEEEEEERDGGWCEEKEKEKEKDQEQEEKKEEGGRGGVQDEQQSEQAGVEEPAQQSSFLQRLLWRGRG